MTNFDKIIIVFSVVLIWRWFWNFADHYIFPWDDTFIVSNVFSILLWVFIIFLHNFNLKKLG
jgi:hypothetical protein